MDLHSQQRSIDRVYNQVIHNLVSAVELGRSKTVSSPKIRGIYVRFETSLAIIQQNAESHRYDDVG